MLVLVLIFPEFPEFKMTDVPRIIEKENPGFREFSAEDFSETVETSEQLVKRKELTLQILTECMRLDLDREILEFLLHQSTGATSLASLSIFDVMLFRDYLKKLEKNAI